MKHFNEDTVRQLVGDRFSIEELHMSMVRLIRQIGQPDSDRANQVFSYGRSVDFDEDADEAQVDEKLVHINKDQVLETELRVRRAQLARLKEETKQVEELNKMKLREQESTRKRLAGEIQEQLARNSQVKRDRSVDGNSPGSARNTPRHSDWYDKVDDARSCRSGLSRMAVSKETIEDHQEAIEPKELEDALYHFRRAQYRPQNTGLRWT